MKHQIVIKKANGEIRETVEAKDGLVLEIQPGEDVILVDENGNASDTEMEPDGNDLIVGYAEGFEVTLVDFYEGTESEDEVDEEETEQSDPVDISLSDDGGDFDGSLGSLPQGDDFTLVRRSTGGFGATLDSIVADRPGQGLGAGLSAGGLAGGAPPVAQQETLPEPISRSRPSTPNRSFRAPVVETPIAAEAAEEIPFGFRFFVGSEGDVDETNLEIAPSTSNADIKVVSVETGDEGTGGSVLATSHGTFQFNGSGYFEYIPILGSAPGIDVFVVTYPIEDLDNPGETKDVTETFSFLFPEEGGLPEFIPPTVTIDPEDNFFDNEDNKTPENAESITVTSLNNDDDETNSGGIGEAVTGGHGIIVFNEDGTYDYVMDPENVLSEGEVEEFLITYTDEDGKETTESLVIIGTLVEDPEDPDAEPIPSAEVLPPIEGETGGTGDPDLSDPEIADVVEPGSIVVTSVDTGNTGSNGDLIVGEEGKFIFNEDGTFDYLPNPDAPAGIDTYTVEYPVEGGDSVTETFVFEHDGEGVVTPLPPTVSNEPDETFFTDPDNKTPDSEILITSLDNGNTGAPGDLVYGDNGFLLFNPDGSYDYQMDPENPLADGELEQYTISYTDDEGETTVETLTFVGDGAGGADELPPVSAEVGSDSDPDPSDPEVDPTATPGDITVTSLDTGDSGPAGDVVDGPRGDLVFNEDGTFDYMPEPGADPGLDTFTVTYPPVGSDDPVTETLTFETKDDGTVALVPPTESNPEDETFFTDLDNETPDSLIVVTSVGTGDSDDAGNPVSSAFGTLVFNTDGSYDYLGNPENVLAKDSLDVFTITYTDADGKDTVETLTFIGDGLGDVAVIDPLSGEIGEAPSDPDETDPKIDPTADKGDIIVTSLDTGDSGLAGDLVTGEEGTLVFNEDGTFDYVADPTAPAGIDTYTVTYPTEGGETVTETLVFEHDGEGTATLIVPDETIDGSFYDDPDNEAPAGDSTIVVKSIGSGEEDDAGKPVNSSHGTLVFNDDGTYDYLVDPEAPLPEGELDVFTITYTDPAGETTVETLTFIGTVDDEGTPTADLHAPLSAEVGEEPGDPDGTDPKVDPAAGPGDILVTSLDTDDSGPAGEIVDGPRGDLLFNEDGTFDYIPEPDAPDGIDTFTVTYPPVDGGDPVTEILTFETKDGVPTLVAPDETIDGSFYDDPDNEAPAEDSTIVVKSIDSGEEDEAGKPVDSSHGTLVFNTDGSYDYVIDPDAPLPEGELDVFTITYTDTAGEETVETLTFIGTVDDEGTPTADLHTPLSAEIGEEPGDPDTTDPKVDPAAGPGDILVTSLDTDDSGPAGEIVDGPRGDLLFNEDGTFDYIPEPDAPDGIDTFTVTYPPVDGGDPVTEILTFETKDGVPTLVAPDETIDGSFYDDPDNEAPAEDSSIVVKSIDSGEEDEAGKPVDSSHGTLVFNTDGSYDYVIDPDAPLPEGELDVFTITYTDTAGEETVETLTFIGTVDDEGTPTADLHDPFSAEIGGEGDPDVTDRPVDPEATAGDILVTSLDTDDSGPAGEIVDGPRGDLLFNEDGTFDYIPEPDAPDGIDTFTVEYPVEGVEDPVVETLIFKTEGGVVSLVPPGDTTGGDFFDDPDNETPAADSEIEIKSIDTDETGEPGDLVKGGHGTLIFNADGTYDYLVDPSDEFTPEETDVFTITYTDEAGLETVETLTFTGDGAGGATEVDPTSDDIVTADDSDNPEIADEADPTEIKVTSINTGDEGEAGDLVDGEIGTLVFNPDGTFDFVLDPEAPEGVDVFTVEYPTEDGPVTETLTFSHDGEGAVEILDPVTGIIGGAGDPDVTDPEVEDGAEPDEIIVSHPESGEEVEGLEPITGDFGTFVVNPDGTFDYVPVPDAPEGSEDTFLVTYPTEDGPITETFTFEHPGDGTAELVVPDSTGDLDDPVASPDIDGFFPIKVTSVETGDIGTPGEPVTGDDSDIVFNPDGSYDVNVHPDSDATDGETEVFTVSYTDPEGERISTDLVVEYDGEGGVNVLPVSHDGDATIVEDTANVTGTVAAFDTDDATPIAYSLEDGTGALGALTINSSTGAFDYTLDNGLTEVQSLAVGETATEEFTYIATDGEGGTSTATISIVIEGKNDAPIGTADDITLTEDGPLTVAGTDVAGTGTGLLANDSDVDASDSHRVSSMLIDGVPTTIPTGGEATRPLGGGTLTLRSDGGYTFVPGSGYHDLATDEEAVETFTYTMTDGNGGTSTASVSLTITGVNDPVAAAPVEAEAGEDSEGVTIDPIADGVTDVDTSDTHEITLIDGEDPTEDPVTLDSGAIVTLSGGRLDYDPAGSFESLGEGESTTDTFTYTVTDGETTATETVTVVITGANDAPVIDLLAPDAPATEVTVTEEVDSERDTRVSGTLAGIASDVDESDSLAFDTPDFAEYGEFELREDGRYTYNLDNTNEDVNALNEGESLVETFEIIVEDEDGEYDVTDFTVTINGSNDSPELDTGEVKLVEDTSLKIKTSMLSTIDPDDDPSELTYTADVTDGTGSFEVDGVPTDTFTHADVIAGKVNFVPVGEEAPEISITVTDSGGATDTADLDIDFRNVNDAPVIELNAFTIDEGARFPITTSEINATDSDHGAAELVFTPLGVTGGSFVFSGTTSAAASFTLADIEAGRIDFLHDGSEIVPNYTLKVADPAFASDTDSVTLTLVPINDAPEITVNTLDIVEGGRVKLTPTLLNSADADNSSAQLVYTVVALAGGAFETAAGAAIDPATGFSREALESGDVYFRHDGGEAAPSYTVRVTDPGGLFDESAAGIEFENVNDSPIAGDDDALFTEDEAPIGGDVFENDVDPDSTLAITKVNGSGSTVGSDVDGEFGTLKLNSNGSYTYEQGDFASNLDFGQTVVETFTYVVGDGDGASDTAELKITVTGVNDAPIVVDEIDDITLEVEGVGGSPVVADARGVEVVEVGSEAFARGKLVEIGIRDNGTFGAAAGSRPGTPTDDAFDEGFHNPRKSLFGFIANPQDNDWEEYDGDFFSPGTPEEGFGIEVNGTNYNNNTVGIEQIAGSITGVQEAVLGGRNVAQVLWNGSVAGVDVARETTVSEDGLWILMKTTLTNTTGGDLSNVYWHNNVDPDNDQSVHGDYVTTNRVLAQPGDGNSGTATGDFDGDGAADDFEYTDTQAIVLATQTKGTNTSSVAYVADDARARVTSGGFSNRDASNIWDGTGFISNEGGTETADRAISIAFKFDTIEAGESETFYYAYNLVADPTDALSTIRATSSPVFIDLLSHFDDINSDDDASTLSYAVTLVDGSDLPDWLTFDGRFVIGSPPEGAVGLNVKVTATDQHGATATDVFSIGTPPGDAPTFDAGPDAIILDWATGVDYDSGPFWFDGDGDTLTFSLESEDGTVSGLTVNGITVDSATGALSGAPIDPTEGIVILADDGTGITEPGRTPVITFNQPPVTDAETGSTDEDTSVVIDVVTGDTDPEGGDVTLTSATASASGASVSIDAVAGTVTYDPGSAYQSLSEGQTATDTFTYEVQDAEGHTSTETVNVTIIGTNDKPAVEAVIADRIIVQIGGSSLLSIDLQDHFEDIDLLDTDASLTYSGSEDGLAVLPAGFEISGSTLTANAALATVGIHDIIVSATDSAGAFVSTGFTVTVVAVVPPIVIDLDGDGVEFDGLDEGLIFDIDGDGISEASAWAGNDDAVLIFDKDGNGDVTDRSEFAFADYREGATSDLEGLLTFDTDGDRALDVDDADFAKFALWQDADGDGAVGVGEMTSLLDAGVESILLDSDGISYETADGEVFVQGTTVVNYADGTTTTAADAMFQYEELAVSDEIPGIETLVTETGEAIEVVTDEGDTLTIDAIEPAAGTVIDDGASEATAPAPTVSASEEAEAAAASAAA